MKHTQSEANPIVRAARWLVYASVLTAAFLITMGIAYTWVVNAGREELHKRARPIDVESEVELLQDLRQATKALYHEFGQRAAVERRAAASPLFTDWLANDFTPRLDALRRRIQSAPLAGDSLSALLVASDRIAAWTKHPADEQSRTSTSYAIDAADDAVDQRIGALQAGLAL